MRKTYTTGQIARVLYCASRTVSKWIDSGRMRGYRLPNVRGGTSAGQDRRVLHDDLMKFMVENQFPLSMLEGIMDKILVGSRDQNIVEGAMRAAATFGLQCEITSSWAEIGHHLASKDWWVVVLDQSLDSQEAALVLSKARRSAENVLLVLNEDSTDCFNVPSLQRPASSDKVEAKMVTLLAGKGKKRAAG